MLSIWLVIKVQTAKIKKMNSLTYTYCILLFALLTLINFSACQHDHDHGHDDHSAAHDGHDDHDDHEGHDHETIIRLNKAQYINAEIDTGWFSMKNLSDVIYANGYTKLDPKDQAEVSMPVAGTIKSIEVIEGDYVKKGATLATMESLEYSKMILENNNLLLERNKLQLEKANLKMEKAKLEEALAVGETNIIYLQKEYDRQEALSNSNINGRKLFEKVQTDLAIEQAQVKAHKNQIEQLNKTIAMFGNSAAAYQDLNLSDGKSPSIGSGGSKLVKITAPISGHITHIDIKIGSTVKAGQDMFALVDNSQMHVDLLVYEQDLYKVKVGQTVRFMLTNQSNQEIRGEIYNIGKSFANETKSVAVHADIEENDANLIPGMYINALIDIGESKVQAVPNQAVVMAEGREFVYLWEKENKNNAVAAALDEITFVRLEVKTGSRQLGYVQVTPLDEIHDGDKIVLNGAYYLQSHLQKAEGGGGHHH